ncbi:hypothetical protein ACFQY4_41735 [Catellatospora bangladeshensis]|uniref:hypothetical protein n=1 Tax=Catellatospora bangladeshensis TaxID=310355 RepID=UPI003615AE3D
MSDGVNDPQQEALGELALATLALDEHDAEHAVRHLAAALGHDPRLPEAHELLAKIAARADDGGLGLFHPGERATAGRVVAFAHVLARHGRHADALTLLAQATVHDPARPWADVSWVQALDAAEIAPEHLLRVLLSVLGALPDPAPAHIARATRPYLDLARRALLAHPREALLHGAASGVARRLRELPLALAWAERGYACSPASSPRCGGATPCAPTGGSTKRCEPCEPPSGTTPTTCPSPPTSRSGSPSSVTPPKP